MSENDNQTPTPSLPESMSPMEVEPHPLPPPLPQPVAAQMELFPARSVRAHLVEMWARLSKLWKRRHPTFRRRFVIGFTAATLAGLTVWFWQHWTDPDRDFKITNFLAAFYPVPLSVFLAFLPDMERSERMRPVWRVGIVLAGLFYSMILWHQQTVNIASSRQDQKNIVDTAINGINAHYD